MAIVNILIDAGQGQTEKERADGISEELYNISIPKDERKANEKTKFEFARLEHPTTNEACLYHADTEDVINVHNKVNLTQLLLYFDKVPAAEKQALKTYIESKKGGTIKFGDIIPSTAIYITDAQLDSGGWLPDPML